MAVAAVEVRDLAKSYGQVRALDGVSLTVEQGEFFALLGPNGAGKTTLISALGGLAIPDGGRAAVMGHDVAGDFRLARRAVGIVPQEVVFDPFFSVRETLELQSGYFGLRRNGAWIDELLDRLALAPKADANMRSLSGGMKRRVMVAQALVHRPPVIVLDEPTAGVDVELRQTLWSFIRSLNAAGHTILLTTHYLEEAEEMADRIGVIHKGDLVLVEDKDTLMRKLGKKQLTLQLAQPLAQVPAALAGHSLELSKGGNALTYTYDATDEHSGIAALLQDLDTAGIAFKDLQTSQSSLEDIFVSLVREDQ